jgi:hypothetical protein
LKGNLFITGQQTLLLTMLSTNASSQAPQCCWAGEISMRLFMYNLDNRLLCSVIQSHTIYLLGIWLEHKLDEALLDGQDLWEL